MPHRGSDQTEYMRVRRKDKAVRDRERAMARARDKALGRLAALHPEEYRQLLEQVKREENLL